MSENKSYKGESSSLAVENTVQSSIISDILARVREDQIQGNGTVNTISNHQGDSVCTHGHREDKLAEHVWG